MCASKTALHRETEFLPHKVRSQGSPMDLPPFVPGTAASALNLGTRGKSDYRITAAPCRWRCRRRARLAPAKISKVEEAGSGTRAAVKVMLE